LETVHVLRLRAAAGGPPMSVRRLVQAWNEFFFAPQSPTPVCLFRILFGLVFIADLILLRPDWMTWFGFAAS
jgi:hypothetical protein